MAGAQKKRRGLPTTTRRKIFLVTKKNSEKLRRRSNKFSLLVVHPRDFFFGEMLFLFYAKAIIGFPRKYFGAFPFIFLLNFSFYIISFYFCILYSDEINECDSNEVLSVVKVIFFLFFVALWNVYFGTYEKFLIETRTFCNVFINRKITVVYEFIIL